VAWLSLTLVGHIFHALTSVKPTPSGASFFSVVRGPAVAGASVRHASVALRVIIADAYSLDASAAAQGGEPMLVGGETALLNRAFDIEARAPPGSNATQKRLMLRTLLADRFKLKIRQEIRQTPLYVLTLAGKDVGPGLKRSAVDCASADARKQRSEHRP
jgi:uncharacterized protein (TIGR03435 family)